MSELKAVVCPNGGAFEGADVQVELRCGQCCVRIKSRRFESKLNELMQELRFVKIRNMNHR